MQRPGGAKKATIDKYFHVIKNMVDIPFMILAYKFLNFLQRWKRQDFTQFSTQMFQIIKQLVGRRSLPSLYFRMIIRWQLQ